jgi:hypothetical protein
MNDSVSENPGSSVRMQLSFDADFSWSAQGRRTDRESLFSHPFMVAESRLDPKTGDWVEKRPLLRTRPRERAGSHRRGDGEGEGERGKTVYIQIRAQKPVSTLRLGQTVPETCPV